MNTPPTEGVPSETTPNPLVENSLSSLLTLHSRFSKAAIDLGRIDRVQSGLSIRQLGKPDLQSRGLFEPTADQEKLAEGFENVFIGGDGYCAVLLDDPSWDDNPFVLHYNGLKYSEILALRELDYRVRIISSSCLMFCEELDTVILHQRSKDSHVSPNALSTFGGALVPTSYNGSDFDANGFESCIKREVREETNITISKKDLSNTPFVLIDESENYYIQGCYLGIPVPKEQIDRMESNHEGDILTLPFDELEEKLTNLKDWTTSGWCHAMF